MLALTQLLRLSTLKLRRLDLVAILQKSALTLSLALAFVVVCVSALPTAVYAQDDLALKSFIITSLPREVQDEIMSFPLENDIPRMASAEELEEQLTAISNDANLSDEVKTRQKEAVKKEQNLRATYIKLLADFSSLANTLKNSQERLDQLKSNLEQANIDYSTPVAYEDLSTKSLSDINLLIAQTSVELDKAQTDLSNANAESSALQTLPTRVQNTLSANNDRIFEIAKLLNDSSRNLSDYEKHSLGFEAYVLSYENAVIESRLHSITFFQDQANYNIRINSLRNDYFSNYLNVLRNRQTELIAQQATESDNGLAIDNYNQIPKLRSEVQTNNHYTEQINSITLENAQLKNEVKTVENALNTIYQLDKSMQDQISDITESLLLSRLLNRQQNEIPQISISFNLDEMVTNLTISLFDLRILREQLFDVNLYVDNMINTNSQLEPYKEQLMNIMLHRRSLIDQLYQAQSESLSLAVNLRDKYREFTKTANNVNTVINDHLFWLASNSGISIEFFTNFFPNLQKQGLNFITKYNNFDKAKYRLLQWLTVIVPIGLIGFFFHKTRPLIQSRINNLALTLDKPNDSYLTTPMSLVLHLFVIIPLVAQLTALGSVVIFIVLDDFGHQVLITLYLALHLMCFLYIRNILQLNSLVQRHFSFSIERNRRIRMIIDKIWLVSIPMLLIANMRILEPSEISIDQIGYTLMLLGFLYLTVFAFRTAKQHFERYTPNMAFWVMATVGILTPLTLTIMLAIGYYYTVVQVLNRVAITLYIFFLYFITSHTLRRELYVAENKMLKKAQERISSSAEQSQNSKQPKDIAKQNKGKDKENPQENTVLDTTTMRGLQIQALRLDLVNTRSFKLFNGFILCVFVYFMYLQWNDLAGVLNYLNNVYLWSKTSIVDNKEVVTQYLSVGKMLLAIVIVIVTTILAKNLPNLLERLFLLRGNVKNKSTSYTVKIISTYAITAIGIIMAASIMGISWDNLQWLVAALSVGLGFGLQEIFGNFVSGIIILFERQLRVGDIVTLNSLSGTVSKIRIRATTIVAFDNKEVVIPNKQFITSALTNWSLSNTITKLEFAIGIAYDADVNKAKDLLRGILRRCRNLNRDRKPQVFVKSLDASCVTLLCEVYVNEIGKRKETFDYLSVETLRIFKEQGIEIPFDQLDVTIRNLDNGQVLTETQTNIVKGAAVKAKRNPAPNEV